MFQFFRVKIYGYFVSIEYMRPAFSLNPVNNKLLYSFILCHQMMRCPTVNGNADLEFLSTPQCKVRNFSYEFAIQSKNKILRDF